MKYLFKLFGLVFCLFIVATLFLDSNIVWATVGACCNPSDSGTCGEEEVCTRMTGSTIEQQRECTSEHGDDFVGKCLPEGTGESCSLDVHCDEGEECRNVGGVSTYCMPINSSEDEDRDSNTGSGTGGGSPSSTSRLANPLGNIDTPQELIGAIIDGVMGVIGILAVAVLVYGGILYITSGGNEEQAGKAKKAITYAIVGLVISLLSYAIVNAIIRTIGG